MELTFWISFLHYLSERCPALVVSGCSGAHVVEFFKYYLDRNNRTSNLKIKPLFTKGRFCRSHNPKTLQEDTERSIKMALCRLRGASWTLCSRLIRPAILYNGSACRNLSSEGESLREKMMRQMAHLDINSQIGSCMPLANMRIGTIIHNIEVNPGDEKLIDTRCRATIGTVSNASHRTKKLRKAGQSRWLGRRPVVRGVAMNPVDHPHGGGEGRSKSSGNHGRCSLTPWGKPCKSGMVEVKILPCISEANVSSFAASYTLLGATALDSEMFIIHNWIENFHLSFSTRQSN
ncbi:hypothetical protein LWI29_037964 [Acer saccharum]|uniref:Large ribosomal subunit protein uL2 C-terminal domain-containing protein n=1 Tax=Acer saccharum TaxID=4024 RepID=A0AA39TKV0_ACESA|nr:hypothetical protein LWI29_037964 [Acer saccharum]